MQEVGPHLDFLDLVQLVYIAVARKQRLAVHQLAHEAADSPHIDAASVGERYGLALLLPRRPQQQLRRAIPATNMSGATIRTANERW
jgi:hypothetical protein